MDLSASVSEFIQPILACPKWLDMLDLTSAARESCHLCSQGRDLRCHAGHHGVQRLGGSLRVRLQKEVEETKGVGET